MTSANKLIQASAGNAAGAGLAVEEIFSTYLYTGNGSTQTITNDIDLDGEGGLVWIKNRDATDSHILTDTERGATEILSSDSTAAEATDADTLTAFNSDGFAIGADVKVNTNTEDYASWTFRKAPKFFDVQTWTGNGTAGREISHNLGTTVGCVMIKNLSSAENWMVYHRGSTGTDGIDGQLNLNSTAAATDDSSQFNDTVPSSTVLTLGSNAEVNGNGDNYVAYLFAHNDGDGEFGESGDQDIIKCGSFTGNGSSDGPEIDLGFEPQWVMIKRTDSTSPWTMWDVMRGLANNGTSDDRRLKADTSDAESNSPLGHPTATGLKVTGTNGDYNASGGDYIYIAIRRGPMKTPESGTEVFDVNLSSASTGTAITTGFPVDLQIMRGTSVSGNNQSHVNDRLRGVSSSTTEAQRMLSTSETSAEVTGGNNMTRAWGNTGFQHPSYWGGISTIFWNFRRAPGFFDVVAYEGTGSTRTVAHNLGVAPELIIVKKRTGTQATGWMVYTEATGATKRLELNTTGSTTTDIGDWNDTAPTSSVFTVRFNQGVNNSSSTYIAYLFATLPGISKVGSYTGNGTSQTIDCGFSAGARFVMTKRTNTTGNWNVWDSERGIVAGNDPRLELNTTDAEDTGHDYIDPDNSGFVVNYVADDDDDTNVSGDEYIFIAIA